ncbi:MAG: hypothetical protein LBR39_04660 [Coriobacteriales bacterium]|nr:hypothetical protein [Coriobacteriales bacterium]
MYYYAGDATVPLGTITIQETKAPVGYLLPDPNPISLQRIELDSATQQVQRLNPLIVRERPHIAEVLKSDSASGEPVPDTEFTLYRESAPGAGDWQEVLRKVTDENGRFEIRPIAVGSYKLVETCPNPNYASAAESGADDCYFEIEASTTILTLEIVDDPIRIGCEVFKDTVNITSAAFRTNVGDYLQIDNTNRELFHYSLDFRSTASVRADEFTVIDPLESAGMGQVWLQELFTPVAWGDSDGLFNLWYQTNLTDPEKLYSEANAMASNPANPNNPKLEQLWPSVGWQLWQQDVPTTCTSHFLVSDLNLAEGEYVTALRFEFGSVEVGFTTHNSLLQGLQEKKELKPSTVDWTPRPASSTDKVSAGSQLTTLDAASATGLQPATYLVSCPQSLLPPVLLSSSAQVFIARNVVLTDTDSDAVQTSLINTFSVRPNSATPTDISTLAGYGVPRGGSGGRTTVSATGDNVFAVLALLASALGCAGLGVRLLCKRKQLRRGVHARRMWGLQRILRS